MGKMVPYDIRKTGRMGTAIPVRFTGAPAMRKPRVRLCEFLLLTTLASLITAAFAIRASTASHVSAQEHAFHAYQAQLSVNSWEEHIERCKWLLKTAPSISEDWAAGCDLRLMPGVEDASDIPVEGKDLIIVADIYGVFYFRMFDGDGQLVVDTAEGMQVEDLKRQLASLCPPHGLTGIERRQVVTAVMSVLSQSKARLLAGLRSLRAMHSQAVAKAEHHERLARYYGP